MDSLLRSVLHGEGCCIYGSFRVACRLKLRGLVTCGLLLRLWNEGRHRIWLQYLLQIGASGPYSSFCILVGQPRLLDRWSEIAPRKLSLIILNEDWVAALLDQSIVRLLIISFFQRQAEFAVTGEVIVS